MKKQLSKVLMVLITVSMVFSLLPAQIASATADDIAAYAHYGTEEGLTTYGTDGWHGHVFKLEEEAGEYHNYKLTVGVYNIEQSNMYTSALRFDPNVVDLVDYEYGDVFTETTSSSDLEYYIIYPNVDSTMTTNSRYAKETITNKLFDPTPFVLKDSETGYFNVLVNFLTVTGLTESEWTTDAGALYSNIGDTVAYKYPEGKIYPLYTMYFSLKEGQEITSNTFSINYDQSNDFHGGMGKNMYNLQGVKNCEGVYLIGFQEPEKEPGTVKFARIQNSAGDAIQGATVTLYTDSELTTVATTKDGSTELTGTTDANGAVEFTDVPAGTSYYYKVTANNYAVVEEKTNAVSVTENANSEISTITLSALSEVEYDLNVTVIDADTNTAIGGAQVTVSSTPATEGATEASGVAAIRIKAGTYDVTASKTGYQSKTASNVEVTSAGGSVEIKLEPERAALTLPEIKDSEGNLIEGMQLKVTQTEGSTTAWGTSNTYNNGAEIEVPKNSTFIVETVSNDYSKITLYIKSDDSGAATVYTDSDCTVPLTTENEEEALKTEKVGDPIYNVVIKPDELNPQTYTATVTIKNIEANYGTFGLRYDKDLFTLQDNGFVIDTNLTLFDINEVTAELKNPVTTNSAEDTIGYHVFTWGPNMDNGVYTVDALSEEQPIATYKFTLNGTVDQINADSFSVMPYDKTENGRNYIAGAGSRGDDAEITNEFLSELWRYTDEENQAPLGEGRLEEEKAIDRGFYQAFGVTALSSGAADFGCMSDIKTVFEFDLEKQLAGLVFEVVDEAGNTIPNVEITLNDKDGNEVDPALKTDSTGIAKTSVDVTDGDVTYTYTINCDGYWETPLGADTPIGTVTVNSTTPPETEFVYLTLEEKIYHETQLKYDTDPTGDVPETEAVLSGDEYAYNNRDYHFNIEPKPGYKFTEAGNPIKAIVNGETIEVAFSKADNMYVIPAESITGEKTGEANENGFPSDAIQILIPQDSIVPTDATYTVTALAGANGSVTYPDADGDRVVTKDGTGSVVVSNIAENTSTENFTFEAEDGFYIERVIINGVQIGDYTEKRDTKLEYKFENITEDCSIAVTFWDSETPSKDSVVTLVVGDRGKATVTAPEAATVTNERRTFIYNAAGTLAFETEADSGYELNAVEKEVNEGVKENITNGASYNISIGESENVVVYVTFKDPEAEDTFNVFVKAYVDCGEGTISPVGVLTYVKYERPEFTMTAKDGGDWMLTAVKIDGVKQRFDGQSEDDQQAKTGTYKFDSLLEDRSIGAMFAETAYNVYGLVDLSQKSVLYKAAPQTGGAKLVFTRQDDPATSEDETMVVTTFSEKVRVDAPFEAKLAKGTWTVVVTKAGYLSYTITDFTVNGTDTYFGAKETAPETAKPIVLIIGDTSAKGTVVSLEDAGVIGSALRPGAKDLFSPDVYSKADVDDDGYVSADSDMVYVKNNFGVRRIIQTYQEFVDAD